MCVRGLCAPHEEAEGTSILHYLVALFWTMPVSPLQGCIAAGDDLLHLHAADMRYSPFKVSPTALPSPQHSQLPLCHM